MKDIFANLYNKVLSFFHQSENANKESAKDVACNRLKLVLMQDRTNLSPAIMDRMKQELIDLLSKYLELDRELLDLNLEQEDEQMALMLSIPVLRAKDEQEILELLEAEEVNGVDDEEVNDDSESEDDEGVNEGVDDKESEPESDEGIDEDDESDEDSEEAEKDVVEKDNSEPEEDDTSEIEEKKIS